MAECSNVNFEVLPWEAPVGEPAELHLSKTTKTYLKSKRRPRDKEERTLNSEHTRMETLKVNNENKRRKKSDERRSSILKIDRPTLADLDVNKKTEKKISRRSSKRVSFAETYQVKEFPKDSPQRWLRDLHNADNEPEEKGSDGNKSSTGSEILGLDQLLTGQIQSQVQENATENVNKTIIDGVDMDETTCVNTSIRQNTTLSNTVCDTDSDEEKKVDTLSFLNNLMKKSNSGNDGEPFIKPPEDSDEEDYKASSFFRGGSKGFFRKQSETDADEKIDNKSFLAKLKGINSSSKKFSQEREKREETVNQTVVFDGLDADMEMTANFTATLQSFKKRQSTSNVLESTRIYADVDDAMEMTTNLTTNLEVVRSNLPISDFDASKNVASVTGQSRLGNSTVGRSGIRGFDQTRVFSDYEDPTANMDLTVARGEILSNTTSATPAAEAYPNEDCQTGPAVPEQCLANKPEAPAPCPEVTVHFGQQEIDADMEMTEALDPTLVITNNQTGSTTLRTTLDQIPKASRALTDVTAHFEADSLTARKDELSATGKKRKSSISSVDMGKENVTVHFKQVDVQSDMEFTSCLTTHVESQDKENVLIKEQTPSCVSPEKTQVFTGSEDVANMEFTTCIETVKTITVDDTISFKKRVSVPDASRLQNDRESNVQVSDVRKELSSSVNCDVTRVFGSGDVMAAMELTECHMSLPVKQHTGTKNTADVKSHKPEVLEPCEDKTRVFDTGDVTAAMELTECANWKMKRDSSEGKADDRTVHFEKQGGSMELTACHSGLVSLPTSSDAEKTRLFNEADVTAAMELTACVPSVLPSEPEPNSDAKTECMGIDVAKPKPESDEGPPLKGRHSMPNRVVESVQVQVAETTTIQQRRSYYGGMVNTGENFSTQSLKRKLYSFDMMMAGAKAKSVKVAKLRDDAETNDSGENGSRAVTETSSSTDVPAQEKTDDMTCEKTLLKDSLHSETDTSVKAGVTLNIPGKKLSRSSSIEVTEHTHSTTEILKLGTSDQEVSALEVLKNLALEEDTLDDTKLLELRLLAKKNTGDRSKSMSESPSLSSQKNDTLNLTNKTVGNDDVFSRTIESEEPPAQLENDEDGNLTQYNTTTALSMLLSKMNKSNIAETTLVTDKTSAPASPVTQRMGGTLPVRKHGSPEPICSGSKKKPKLEEKATHEKTVEASEDVTLDSIKQPMEMTENDTVTSLDSASSEGSEDHTRGHQSQSAMSLSQSLLSYSLLDKKYDETDGPWDFETFCERMGISQFRPKCNRRSSFNIQPALEADSLHEMLQLQTVTATDTQVKGEMYKILQEQLDRDEEEIEEQQRSVVDIQPPLFNQLRNSLISQEEVHSCYKACQRWAKAKLKRERVAISKQCLQKLKVEKDRLCSGIDDVVTQAERVIGDLASIDTMLADIDEQLEEIKSEPALTESEAKEVAGLQERLHHKTEELEKNEEEKAKLLRGLKEMQQKQKSLESENQKQELAVLKQDEVSDSGRLTEDLQHKLVALERVLEWRVKELSPARDVFLFLYGAIQLSVTYDVVQQRTLDSVSLTSHLSESSSPWSHLACRLVVDTVDCVKLRGRYASRDKLPQMLHEVSGLVAAARNLASEISHIDLCHHVSINDYSVSVSVINTQTIQKVVLTFIFQPGSYSCKPADCLVDVVIGKIQKQKVADIFKETEKSPNCLTQCISVVQNLLNS